MNYIDEVKGLLSRKIRVNDRLLSLYALVVLIKGEEATLKDIHNAWAVDKNSTFHEHWSIKPFEELSEEVQNKDQKYLDAIHEVAKMIKS